MCVLLCSPAYQYKCCCHHYFSFCGRSAHLCWLQSVRHIARLNLPAQIHTHFRLQTSSNNQMGRAWLKRRGYTPGQTLDTKPEAGADAASSTAKHGKGPLAGIHVIDFTRYQVGW